MASSQRVTGLVGAWIASTTMYEPAMSAMWSSAGRSAKNANAYRASQL